jgi:hypothetical protein
MKARREAKGQARALQLALGAIRTSFNADPQRLENVRASALAGNGPVAMFHHFDTGPRRDERRRCTDVKSACGITPRAARIEYGTSGVPAYHVIAQQLGSRRELLDRFPFHPQADQERRRFRVTASPLHHFTQGSAHLIVRQLPASDQCSQYFGPSNFFHEQTL